MEKLVKKAIEDLLHEVIEYPMSYFSEKALQVRLTAKLLENKKLKQPLSTDIYKNNSTLFEQNNIDIKLLEKMLAIPRVQMEYPIRSQTKTKKKDRSKFDIVVLNSQEINTMRFKKNNNYLNPEIAIEIGTEKIGKSHLTEHMGSDFRKLQKAQYGVILNIIRYRRLKTNSEWKKEIEQIISKENLKIIKWNEKPNNKKISCISMIVNIYDQSVSFLNSKNDWDTFDLKEKNNGLTEAIIDKLSKS